MNTHLKGRIFRAGGISYLVLSELSERTGLMRVKALNARRTVHEMDRQEIEQRLKDQRQT